MLKLQPKITVKILFAILKVFIFFLSVPPTIIGLSPETVTVVVNNFVSLSCEATGFPPPTLSWLNERGPIQANTNALIMPGSVSFGSHFGALN